MIKLDTNPSDTQLSQFGWISLLGFPLIGFVISNSFLERWDSTFFWVMVAVGAVTWLASLVNPKLIKPVFLGMMIIALPIGMVISFVLVGAIFYLMVTPVALLFKLIGRDSMNRKLDRSAKSYWHVREEHPDAASYLKQY